MKKIFGLVFLLLFYSVSAFAFQDEPNGFRGLAWGSSLSQFQNKYPDAQPLQLSKLEIALGETDIIKYSVPALGSELSGIPIVAPLEYKFWKGQFLSVYIKMDGSCFVEAYNRHLELYKKLKYLYGEPTEDWSTASMNSIPLIAGKANERPVYLYTWEGRIANIRMIATYNDPQPYQTHLTLTISSTALANEKQLEKERSTKAEYRQGW
nr:MAG TPA: hypothetical protein [Caudoviricetes sp.]